MIHDDLTQQEKEVIIQTVIDAISTQLGRADIDVVSALIGFGYGRQVESQQDGHCFFLSDTAIDEIVGILRTAFFN